MVQPPAYSAHTWVGMALSIYRRTIPQLAIEVAHPTYTTTPLEVTGVERIDEEPVGLGFGQRCFFYVGTTVITMAQIFEMIVPYRKDFPIG